MLRTRMQTAVVPLVLLLACLGGCAGVISSDGDAQLVNAQNASRLHLRDWDLKGLTVDGQPVVIDADTRITIRFAPGGQVAGLAAVNRFSGSYSVSTEGRLSWGKGGFVSTRSAGPPELMEKERAYLRGLGKTSVAILARHMLVLQNDDASTVLTFTETGF